MIRRQTHHTGYNKAEFFVNRNNVEGCNQPGMNARQLVWMAIMVGDNDITVEKLGRWVLGAEGERPRNSGTHQ